MSKRILILGGAQFGITSQIAAAVASQGHTVQLLDADSIGVMSVREINELASEIRDERAEPALSLPQPRARPQVRIVPAKRAGSTPEDQERQQNARKRQDDKRLRREENKRKSQRR